MGYRARRGGNEKSNFGKAVLQRSKRRRRHPFKRVYESIQGQQDLYWWGIWYWLYSYSRCVETVIFRMSPPMEHFISDLDAILHLGVQNAKGHFDLVCLEPDIYADNRMLMQEGKIILPEPNVY